MAFDFIDTVKSLQTKRKTFILSPEQWDKLDLPLKLKWKKIKFSVHNKKRLPKSSGVYAFVVSNRDKNVPINGYIMYIGIVGFKPGSKRNIRQRFTEYVREEKKLGRPLVHMMLNTWKNYIDFHYVEVSPKNYSLEEIEGKLCNALIPPCNITDFEGDIKKAIKAAW